MAALRNENDSVLDFARREGPVTIAAVASKFGLNIEAARRSLEELRHRGLLWVDERSDRSGWSRWHVVATAPAANAVPEQRASR